jgi:hypothetical protein
MTRARRRRRQHTRAGAAPGSRPEWPLGMMLDLAPAFGRRAALLRELAVLEESLAGALSGLREGPPDVSDEALGLAEAARLMGEEPSIFRRKPEYRKARLSRRGKTSQSYSRAALERIKLDRLASRR